MTSSPAEPAGIRLQKVLAAAGLGSRRACEALIAGGRVEVNGRQATLGARVDADRDVIRVDGAAVPTAAGLVYLAVHKPRGVLSTMADERGRPCVGDLVGDVAPALHHVGRLDADSEGLLLVSNDGELSHRLMHPSFGVAKRYLADVAGAVSRSGVRTLLAGVTLEDGPARADEVVVIDSTSGRSVIELVIHDGRNHVVRRMLAELGHPVHRLVRTAVGPVRLGDLKPGRRRHIQPSEVRALYQQVGL